MSQIEGVGAKGPCTIFSNRLASRAAIQALICRSLLVEDWFLHDKSFLFVCSSAREKALG